MASQRDDENRDDRDDTARPEGHASSPVSPWEWVVAAIGLVLVLGSLGFLLYRAIAGGDTPPLVAIEVGAIEEMPGGYLVTFTATNRGDITAAALEVEGAVRDATGTTETSSATISYVPGHSKRQGGLYFTTDPRHADMHVRAKGFEQP